MFIDTETTGLIPSQGEIIEFAAIKTNVRGEEPEELYIKIRPKYLENPPPGAQVDLEEWKAGVQRALKINGYDANNWVSSMSIEQALPFIVEFLKDCVVAGQNVGFDITFLEEELKRAKIEARLPYHKVDLATLAYTHLVPKGLMRLNLISICEFLKISTDGAHTAIADVRMTKLAYDMILKDLYHEELVAK